MTNNEIIFETVRNTFTPAQLAELVQATYTAEQIAARRAAEAAGQDTPETDPHFYMTKAHLFHALQVEKSKR